MSRTGNAVVEMQETPEYQMGWTMAQAGNPRPTVPPRGQMMSAEQLRLEQAGYDAYHNQEQSK